jgi:predicted ATPase/transcriptional regulator with XRE-family HTH domain
MSTSDGDQSFGQLLREHRLAANLTQAALCERAGISTRGLQDLERGSSQPHRDTVARLEAALGLSADSRAALRRAAKPSPRRRVAAGQQVESATVVIGTGEQRNLPHQFTSFIGREALVAEAVRLLGGQPPRARLLTLTGTGGVGKTRLALTVAEKLPGAQFPDGLWLVELAPLADAVRIRQTIAATLGLQEEPGRTFAELLLDTLRSRRLLLVFDNCEHLVQACAELTYEILRACPGVSVLATSREPLGIVGETILRVPPLARPRAAALEPLDELRTCEAVRLFAERAGAAHADFSLTASNATAVARICERLDGIPLALELAAAQVRALSVEQIAARLDQSFRLLGVANRAAPHRQQTLEAALSWSYDLLSEPEQRLFTRLAVFAGGWSLAAAEEICSGHEIGTDQVVELLARLIDKSLVVAVDGPAEGKRYHLLEPLRQFALDRQGACGEEQRIKMKHFAWYARLAEESERAVRFTVGPATPKVNVLLSIGLDQDNLRMAWQWAASGDGDVRLGLRMAAALLAFHYSAGYLSEGRAWLAALLERDANAEPSPERARALSAAASLALEDGDNAAARGYAAEYLRLPASVGDPASEGGVYHALGMVALREGDFPNARALLNKAVILSHQSGEVTVSLYLNSLAEVSLREGHLDEAQRVYEEALTDARASGTLAAVGLALGGLASVAQWRGDAARAETLYEEGVAVFDEVGALPHAVSFMLVALGYLALAMHKIGCARRRFDEALNRSAALGHQRMLCAALGGLGLLALEPPAPTQASLESALRVLGAAAALGHVEGMHRAAEAALYRARESLGDAVVDKLLLEGRALPLERAIAMARTGAEQIGAIE